MKCVANHADTNITTIPVIKPFELLLDEFIDTDVRAWIERKHSEPVQEELFIAEQEDRANDYD